MKSFEHTSLTEDHRALSTATLSRALGDMLDAIYAIRTTYALLARDLAKALELRTFPKSRRPFAQTQVDLFLALARGEHESVAFQRDASTYRSIRSFGAGFYPEIVDDHGAPTDDGALLDAFAAAVIEIRNLRSLSDYEALVLDAHKSSKSDPKSMLSFIDRASAELSHISGSPLDEIAHAPYRADGRSALKAAGAPVTLTTPQYIDVVSAAK